MLPDEEVDANFIGEFSEVIDRGEEPEPVLLPGEVILRSMAGSDVDRTRAGLGRDKIRQNEA